MKFDLRLQLVRYALDHGVKPAARQIGCTPRIARKWYKRWLASGRSRQSLVDRSRAPRSCPHKTSPRVEAQIVREREKAPCLGARRLKDFCAIPASEGAIARVLRQNGLARRRKKKYEKKRDMRELKARFAPFEENRVDVKYLTDIPYYVEQLARNPSLPRFEYTWRDVKTGAVFLGFANELSETHACCFAAAVGAHLGRTGFSLARRSTVQSDNGAEFSGTERKTRDDRGFTHLIESTLRAKHRFIPPGKKNHQADVETVHERIEEEFFNLERFADRKEFFLKTSAWQLWWNTTRKNSYKANRTPDQILLETRPQRNARVWFLRALDLDTLLARRANPETLNKSPTGGYYVPALPVFPELFFIFSRERPPSENRHFQRRIAGLWRKRNTRRDQHQRRPAVGKRGQIFARNPLCALNSQVLPARNCATGSRASGRRT
jgi:hypothetical protein